MDRPELVRGQLRPHQRPTLQGLNGAGEDGRPGPVALVPRPARLLLRLLGGPPRGLEVGQRQLRDQGLVVRDRVDGALGVRHRARLERAEEEQDGVGLPHVGQKAIPEPLSLVGAANEAGDVHESDVGGDHPLGPQDAREGLEPRVGQEGHPHVGLDGGEGVGGHRRVGLGQRVEERGLPGVRQTDDPDLEHDPERIRSAAPGAAVS